MKALLIISACLTYYASASFYDALDHDSADMVVDFWAGMNQAPHLATIIPEFVEEANIIEQEVKSQLAWSVRDILSSILQRIRETIGKAEKAAKTALIKVAERVEKLKTLAGAGEELQKRIADKVKDWIKAFLEKLNLNSQEYSLMSVSLQLDEKRLMESVKQNILERLNLKDFVEYIKAKLSKLGEVSRSLLDALQQPGALEGLKALLETILPGQHQDYSLQDLWAKVRDFFKGLGVKISEKFFEFSNWLKELAQKGWKSIVDKTERLKELAKTVAAKAGTMSKQAAEQALEFFREHKAEIGQFVWSLVKGALTAAIISAG